MGTHPIFESDFDCLTDYSKMSPGIADQLLLLIDEIEELTMEIFASVQNNTPSDNLVEMLIKKDRQLAQLLQTANEQKQLYDKIENYKEQIKKYDTRILNFQSKLLEAEGLLLPVLHQAKERLKVIKSARQNKVNSEEIVRYSHKISACHATSSPIDWVPGNPKRPYPTDVDMRAGILSQFHPNQQQTNNTDVPRPEAPLGTDGLMAIMKNNQEPVTRIGDTWRPGGQVRPDEPAPRLLPPASPALRQAQ